MLAWRLQWVRCMSHSAPIAPLMFEVCKREPTCEVLVAARFRLLTDALAFMERRPDEDYEVLTPERTWVRLPEVVVTLPPRAPAQRRSLGRRERPTRPDVRSAPCYGHTPIRNGEDDG